MSDSSNYSMSAKILGSNFFLSSEFSSPTNNLAISKAIELTTTWAISRLPSHEIPSKIDLFLAIETDGPRGTLEEPESIFCELLTLSLSIKEN